MTGSGSAGSDATNDSSVETSLETGTDLCITVGVQYNALSTVSGSVTTSNYDVIYLQGQNNWGSGDMAAFQANDLAVIEAFLTAGGGVVIGEWLAWDACAMSLAGAWAGLDALMPTTIRSGCAYGSGMKVRFYRWDRPVSTALDTGVSSDFVFQPADYAGSLSYLTLKSGATPYYWARWNAVLANVPVAIDPTGMPSDGGVGMAGWVPTGKSGRVFSFSTTNGAPELTDTSASNSFRRLLVNSLGWAGSVGGAITPDSLTVSGAAGGSVSSPAFTPTNLVGTVTYSIVSGTLPAGLTLNPSTGQISGTPTNGASTSLTIQATGSTSGTAQAVVALSISGPAATTTTAPAATTSTTSTTSTTVAGVSSNAVTTTTAATATTTTAPTDESSDVPETGSLPVSGVTTEPAVLALAMVLCGGLVISRRRRRQAG